MPVKLFDFDPGQKIFELEAKVEKLLAENAEQKQLIKELVEGLENLIPFMYPDERYVAVAKARELLTKAKAHV